MKDIDIDNLLISTNRIHGFLEDLFQKNKMSYEKFIENNKLIDETIIINNALYNERLINDNKFIEDKIRSNNEFIENKIKTDCEFIKQKTEESNKLAQDYASSATTKTQERTIFSTLKTATRVGGILILASAIPHRKIKKIFSKLLKSTKNKLINLSNSTPGLVRAHDQLHNITYNKNQKKIISDEHASPLIPTNHSPEE